MKRFALGLGVVLAGAVASADDRPTFRGAGADFRFETTHTRVEVGSKAVFQFKPSVEERLNRIEGKLARILKELEGRKGGKFDSRFAPAQ